MNSDPSATTVAEPGASMVAGERQDGGGIEDGLLERLDRMQTALLARTEAAAMWQARAELLAGELAAARDQVRALQAPSPEPEPASPAPDAVGTPQDPPRRRWWQRILFG